MRPGLELTVVHRAAVADVVLGVAQLVRRGEPWSDRDSAPERSGADVFWFKRTSKLTTGALGSREVRLSGNAHARQVHP